MASIKSRLGVEREREMVGFFPSPVRFHLLYKGSHHGLTMRTLLSKFDDHGKFLVVFFLKSGLVRGGFMSKSLKAGSPSQVDDAFVFEISQDSSKHFPVQDSSKAVIYTYRSQDSSSFSFGQCLYVSNKCADVTFTDDMVYSTGWPQDCQTCLDVELHRVQDVGDMLSCPWREIVWTESTRQDLRASVTSFMMASKVLTNVRVLLLGPVGTGKSSFINSVRSVMYRRVVNLPIVGTATDGFTKKLRSYNICAEKGGQQTSLCLCDVMPMGGKESEGLSLSDALSVIKGHVPEGYKFQSCSPITQKVSGYKAEPPLTDQIHCVVFVLDASKVTTYDADQQKILKSFRSAISDHDVAQLVVLTHVDEVCSQVQKDVKYVYYSPKVQEKIHLAAGLVGLPPSYVLPVKNYEMEHSVNCHMDILLLKALQNILLAVDDNLEDSHPELPPVTPNQTEQALTV